jgi:hypothetical protein
MPNASVRANAQAIPEATERPAAAPPPVIPEDAEILAPRAEFERLDAVRQPLVDVTSELSGDLIKVCTEKGWEATKTWADETNYDRMV